MESRESRWLELLYFTYHILIITNQYYIHIDTGVNIPIGRHEYVTSLHSNKRGKQILRTEEPDGSGTHL